MKSLHGKLPTVTEAATLLGGISLVVLLTSACGGGEENATPGGGAAGMTAAAGAASAGASTNGTSGTTGDAGTPGVGGTGSGSAGTPSSGGSSAGSSAAGAGAGAGGSSAGSSTGGGSAGMSGGGSGGSGSGACAQATPINKSTCTAGESNCFSFFVASRARMFKLAQAFNGSTKGWGGDFRYGTADGLTGADKLCTQIAEESLPGNCRTWRAFLTTSKVNAIDRVGKGPWYDRLNRTIANNLTELADTRPGGITVASILNNLPNEDGTPHHNEEADCANANSCADNHDVLTGSDSDGKACTANTCGSMGGGFPGGGGPGGGGGGTTITDWTCKDWTLSTPTAGIAPRCGHTWPTMTGGTDDWISRLTENGCAPGFNLVQNGGPMPTGNGSVGDGGGYGAIYCLALSE